MVETCVWWDAVMETGMALPWWVFAWEHGLVRGF